MRGVAAVADVPEWNPDDPAPGYLYRRFADHLAALIAAGRYPVNSMLPNEREMSVEFGVSIDTVRRAMIELRERGLVVTLPSKGTFVTGRVAGD
jgi:DNA-binding GntR family transcriptional regulator